ncbi:MAG: PaaI family thioesterase [Eggerthellaceae bacterium]|nr:PaaI family thioesterase [Eggerthellaceae bacterium]
MLEIKTPPEGATLEEINEYFKDDTWATEAAGCIVVEGSKGHSVVEMELTPIHYNAFGNVMGGAIFTLADFALAVACNIGEKPTVGISDTIDYLKSSKGKKLIATCDADHSGNTMGFYTITIKDDLGAYIAKMSAVTLR